MFKATGDCHFHFVTDTTILEEHFAEPKVVDNHLIWELPDWLTQLKHCDGDCVIYES